MADVSPNGAGLGAAITEIEATLARIPTVRTVRVVPAGNRIAEIHVLADQSRSPKQLVRDVQSVALANFGLDVDYRTVSVVQLEDVTGPVGSPERAAGDRPALLHVTSENRGHATEVDVAVRRGNVEYAGRARGPSSTGLRLVARAAVDAIGQVAPEFALDVDFAEIVPAGDSKVAIVILRLASPRGDQVASGSAIVRKDAADAVTRATLAASNRLCSFE